MTEGFSTDQLRQLIFETLRDSSPADKRRYAASLIRDDQPEEAETLIEWALLQLRKAGSTGSCSGDPCPFLGIRMEAMVVR